MRAVVGNARRGHLGGCCSSVAEVGVDCYRVVALQRCGKLLDAVVVGSGLFLWCGQCGGEVAEKLKGGLTKSAVSFEDDRCNGVWVVFVVLV